ncbi:hypothetical protein SHLO109777_11700 [Shewanella loihica]|uniref:Uncharacterized protein n=2 Tax=Shewanella TaxID=22 RepID=A3QCC2_SHELP|nr:hypothetical protein Shew_1250 [Shewanella loihica PV-4]
MNPIMPNRQQLTPPDAIKLFEFLDSETPATMKWIEKYLSKQGVFLQQGLLQSELINSALAKHFLSKNTPPSDIKLFAKKMGNAWRAKKHRKNKNLVTLSISLNRDVSNQLTQMCKGHNKTDIVTQLITENYCNFLAEQKAIKEKLAEEKRVRQIEAERAKHEQLLKRSTPPIAQLKQQNTSLLAQRDELENGIAKLYDIIFLANEQGKKIDNDMLIEATKLYYNVFNK